MLFLKTKNQLLTRLDELMLRRNYVLAVIAKFRYKTGSKASSSYRKTLKEGYKNIEDVSKIPLTEDINSEFKKLTTLNLKINQVKMALWKYRINNKY